MKVVLEVKKILSFGVILGEREILLPKRYVPKDCNIGDSIEVFVYTDSEDRVIATTLEPLGVLGEIVYLQVVDVNQMGVFLDLGIAKDILLPCKDAKRYKRGEKVLVQIGLDREGRLLASQRLDFQRYKGRKYVALDVLPYRETPLGFECVVEKKYQGMLFSNEIFESIVLGERYQAQVKNTRKDGKIDLKLIHGNEAERLLEVLKNHQGRIKLTKQSDPAEIARVCHMSKKSFKRALSHLAQEVGQDEESIFVR